MTDQPLTAQDLLAAYGISVEEGADEWRGVLVIAECGSGGASDASLRALGVGREVADAFGARLEALVLGAGEQAAQSLIRCGADRVLLAAAPAAYDQEIWTAALAGVIQQRRPEVVIFGGSEIARDIAARAAQRGEAGLILAVRQVRAEADERVVVGVVPLFGGRLVGEFACAQRRPQMIGLAEGVGPIPTADPAREGEVERVSAGSCS